MTTRDRPRRPTARAHQPELAPPPLQPLLRELLPLLLPLLRELLLPRLLREFEDDPPLQDELEALAEAIPARMTPRITNGMAITLPVAQAQSTQNDRRGTATPSWVTVSVEVRFR
jgi:hypothetical protein